MWIMGAPAPPLVQVAMIQVHQALVILVQQERFQAFSSTILFPYFWL